MEIINTLLLMLLAIIGVGAVVADIYSADRALYYRMKNGGEK